MYAHSGLTCWLRLPSSRGISLSLVQRPGLKAPATKSFKSPSKDLNVPIVQNITLSDAQYKKTQEYLLSLNEEQHKAALCSSPAVRVKAGPGSGKTRVVTARVAHLLSQGISSSGILVITFTNKASEELKERLGHLLGTNVAKDISTGTFHSVCARILRSYIEDLPGAKLKSDFTIFDRDDSDKVMRQVVDSFMGDTPAKEANKLAKEIVSAYSQMRNQHASLHDVKITSSHLDSCNSAAGLATKFRNLPNFFSEYTRLCRESNGLDFDDLLGVTVALLQKVPQAREELQQRWRHILVDEFQDTNSAQYHLVKLISPSSVSNGSVFVVGDPDQAIYEWRGANPENMENQFELDFKGCETMFLNCNYRSFAPILGAAEGVLSHGGMPKLHQPLMAVREGLGHVEHVHVEHEREEAGWVTSQIRQLKSKEGSKYEDIAVLYRTNLQSRSFEESLTSARIPFRVLGEKPFWQRSEIKDMTCYLRLTSNPSVDVVALNAIINTPSRGLGAKTLEKLQNVAEAQGVNLAQLLMGDMRKIPLLDKQTLEPLLAEVEMTKLLPDRTCDLLPDIGSTLSKEHQLKLNKEAIKGLKQLRALVLLARSTAYHRTVAGTVKVLELASGYRQSVEEGSQGDNAPKKLRNLDILHSVAGDPDSWASRDGDLRNTAKGFSSQDLISASGGTGRGLAEVEMLDGEERPLQSEPSPGMNSTAGGGVSGLGQLPWFLQHVSLMRELDELKDNAEAQQRVSLMTLHTSKGLEFRNVFFVGFEDGIVPLIRGQDEGARNLDEEKRLAYVGITRAMDRLYILTATKRSILGIPSQRKPATPSRYLKRLLLTGAGIKSTSTSSGQFSLHNNNDNDDNDNSPFRGRAKKEPSSRQGVRTVTSVGSAVKPGGFYDTRKENATITGTRGTGVSKGTTNFPIGTANVKKKASNGW
ncbi:hypothetical protein CEUSTIGMA_g3062.t1 [Chlamydomonas eustigma]|uniref:DNA 3'-5' helicase n=1 Tax=Chlamydomonas eustigma TaxID=1157962 RepID=A0A250WXP4_9CHLO|nr:hypothetical protein CEUSTIGMA_g3062.t1 [Chlamydomonas eustigma]|eukprot:GAX75618.1 hypothetical protein CEUSTIGMA_g3062.t1 [Chlamydomonas eustigma]